MIWGCNRFYGIYSPWADTLLQNRKLKLAAPYNPRIVGLHMRREIKGIGRCCYYRFRFCNTYLPMTSVGCDAVASSTYLYFLI